MASVTLAQGPTPDERALWQSRVTQARADLQAAEEALIATIDDVDKAYQDLLNVEGAEFAKTLGGAIGKAEEIVGEEVLQQLAQTIAAREGEQYALRVTHGMWGIAAGKAAARFVGLLGLCLTIQKGYELGKIARNVWAQRIKLEWLVQVRVLPAQKHWENSQSAYQGALFLQEMVNRGQSVSVITAARSAALIFDTSGSMAEKGHSGKSKLDEAKQAVRTVLSSTPLFKAEWTLVQCSQDIPRVIVPFTQDTDTILTMVDAQTASGNTPLARSMEAAVAELENRGQYQNGQIIVMSDGKDTCNGDPVAVARRIRDKYGPSFLVEQRFGCAYPGNRLACAGWSLGMPVILASTLSRMDLSVVGFDVAGSDDERQLQAIADAAGGRYYSAKDSRELVAALACAVREPGGVTKYCHRCGARHTTRANYCNQCGEAFWR